MKLFVLMMSAILMVILEGYQIKCCLENERDGLFQIISDLFLTSWPLGDDKSDCCEWEGVKCSPSSGHITHLFLNNSRRANYGPPINMSIFNQFKQLTTLDLSSNGMDGVVQTTQGVDMLKNLQYLDLSFNYIDSVPDSVLNLSSLRVLDLSGGNLTGKLDDRLCGLRNIRELYLSSNNLNGTFPTCLWNLTSLQVLNLMGNSMSGSLPSPLNLRSLEWLSIEGNDFHGKFSFSSLKNHSSLKILILSNNAVQVEIGDSPDLSTMQLLVLGLANCNLSSQTKSLYSFLSYQSNLQYIDLSSNGLVGSFPTWLLRNNSNLKFLYIGSNLLTGDLQLPKHNLSLEYFDISSNQFGGFIPGHIGMTLSALKVLQMSNNSFQGRIPSSMSNMTQLTRLDLSNNKLFGEVPKKLFSDCTNLGFLVLSNNHLEGEIIPSTTNFSFFFALSLDNNHFGGTIKESMSLFPLYYLDISNNEVKGELPAAWIGESSSLQTLSLAGNQFHGEIPSQICNTSMNYLDLSENKFSGKIPSCGCPPELTSLHLHGNNLNGEIPFGISSCSKLKVLDLASNQLSGVIPRWIHVLSDLEFLMLADNQLQGEIPIQLCQLQHLNIIDLSINNISGAIPPCFQNLSFGALERDLSLDQTVDLEVQFDPLPLEWKNHNILQYNEGTDDSRYEKVEFIVKSRYASYKGNILSSISALDLSCNQLSGQIPSELGELKMLHALNFSHNQLSGPIPESFSKLKSIESLDLSCNKLSGTIPSQLVDLNFLEVFNVSYNNLSGGVPETGQFGSFDENSYRGNPLLCGPLLPKSCMVLESTPSSTAEWDDEGDTAFDWEVFFWSFGMSFIVALLAVFLVLYINSEWRGTWFAFMDFHLLWWLY